MDKNIPSSHRLAAIMFLDMVGYSALMSRDTPKALNCVREMESIISVCAPKCSGKLIKLLGDGAIVEFPTGLAAVQCGREILEAIASRNAGLPKQDRFEVRVGIHLGELFEKDGDIFGDSVNIAARVQPKADTGGISMTGAVYSQVKSQMVLRGTLTSPVKLKNIPEKMRLFLMPPDHGSYLFWKIRKRLAVLPGWAGIVLMGLLALSIWAGIQKAQAPVRLGLLYIRTPQNQSDSDPGKTMLLSIEERLNLEFSSIPEVQWVTRAGVLDLFAQEGVEDPSAIERMEIKACKAARRGGLTYSLVCYLEPSGKKRWRLNSKIVCTKIRSVIGSFVSEGEDPDIMVQDLVAQFKVWLKAV